MFNISAEITFLFNLTNKTYCVNNIYIMYTTDQIIGKLRFYGYTITKAAEILKVKKQAVSQEVNHKRISKRIRTGLADLIQTPYEVVWGKNSD